MKGSGKACKVQASLLYVYKPDIYSLRPFYNIHYQRKQQAQQNHGSERKIELKIFFFNSYISG